MIINMLNEKFSELKKMSEVRNNKKLRELDKEFYEQYDLSESNLSRSSVNDSQTEGFNELNEP